MSPALRQRLREAVPTAILAVTIYVPLLLTKPGRVGADTKSYLYLDPSRMLARATSMWDPNIGMGTVTHQNIGYLWPIGPWYWMADHIGMADWVAVDANKMEGVFKKVPDRDQHGAEIKEALIVELYSR